VPIQWPDLVNRPPDSTGARRNGGEATNSGIGVRALCEPRDAALSAASAELVRDWNGLECIMDGKEVRVNMARERSQGKYGPLTSC